MKATQRRMQVKPLHTFKYKHKNENIIVNEEKLEKRKIEKWVKCAKINTGKRKERKNKTNNNKAFQSEGQPSVSQGIPVC